MKGAGGTGFFSMSITTMIRTAKIVQRMVLNQGKPELDFAAAAVGIAEHCGMEAQLREAVSIHPARLPFGTGFSGIASTGVTPSSYPTSKSMPSEMTPLILRDSRLRTNNACLPT